MKILMISADRETFLFFILYRLKTKDKKKLSEEEETSVEESCSC
jgi:hypothetical protein